MISTILQILGLQPQISKKNSRSLEQFFLTVVKNNFGNKISFLKWYPIFESQWKSNKINLELLLLPFWLLPSKLQHTGVTLGGYHHFTYGLCTNGQFKFQQNMQIHVSFKYYQNQGLHNSHSQGQFSGLKINWISLKMFEIFRALEQLFIVEVFWLSWFLQYELYSRSESKFSLLC